MFLSLDLPGSFRLSDLNSHRIHVIRVHITPLRERLDDIR